MLTMKCYNVMGVPVSPVTITSPGNEVAATFSADNVVDWIPVSSDTRFDFWFNPVVSKVTEPPYPRVIVLATVRIEPETLNLGSKGVITMFVTLPEPYNVRAIQIDMVRAQSPTGVLALRGNVAGDKLIFKFDRTELTNLHPGDAIEIGVGGLLKDGSIFQGSDAIRIIP